MHSAIAESTPFYEKCKKKTCTNLKVSLKMQEKKFLPPKFQLKITPQTLKLQKSFWAR